MGIMCLVNLYDRRCFVEEDDYIELSDYIE